jgi:L-ascorbate metabolism protein UlaG (beta-lactamase superfamily)
MAHTSIQLLGHATFKVTTPEGRVIIVDPWLIDNPFIPKNCLPQHQVDLFLVTHGHDDHFDNDMPALIRQTGAKVIANSICRCFLYEKGIDPALIEPMNYGGTIELLDVKVTMVQAWHNAHINVTESVMTHPHNANGYVLHLSDGVRIYFAGDTGIFGDMALIGSIYRPNIAVLPIGDRYTMGPLEAAHAVRLIQAKHVIPFHYGTYPSLTGRPETLAALTADIDDLAIHVLQAGDVWHVDNLS